jgi:hypothetical protein
MESSGCFEGRYAIQKGVWPLGLWNRFFRHRKWVRQAPGSETTVWSNAVVAVPFMDKSAMRE